MGSPRAGSNPAGCELSFTLFTLKASVIWVHFFICNLYHLQGSVAEWSKALVLGTSPKGRGFESHRCQMNIFSRQFVANNVVAVMLPKGVKVCAARESNPGRKNGNLA